MIEGFLSVAKIVFKETTQANRRRKHTPEPQTPNRRRKQRNEPRTPTPNRRGKQQTDAAGTETTRAAHNEPKTTTGKKDYDMQTKESAQFINSAGVPLFPIIRGAALPPSHCLH